MAISKAEEMVKRLREMQAATPEIEASAVVSVDGLTIASALPRDIEEDRVSAMSAAMLSLGDRIASELNRGTLDQVYIHGEDGYVILSAVGDEAVLTAIAKEKPKLGLVFLEMRRAHHILPRAISRGGLEYQVLPSSFKEEKQSNKNSKKITCTGLIQRAI